MTELLDEIFDIEPPFGLAVFVGPEPSLRTIVYQYYAAHFEPDLAIHYAEQYFDVLGDVVRTTYD